MRGDDDRIRVFLNTCRHRGAMVETEPSGCRKRFRCLYHHWEYDTRGSLVTVPRKLGYAEDFRKEHLPLVQLPKFEIFCGLIGKDMLLAESDHFPPAVRSRRANFTGKESIPVLPDGFDEHRSIMRFQQHAHCLAKRGALATGGGNMRRPCTQWPEQQVHHAIEGAVQWG